MTTAIIEIGSLISRSPEIRGGRPIIAGTGITVRRLVSWYKLGLTPEEILNRIGHPHLNLAKIYAALAYYHANKGEIENDLAQEEIEVQQFEKEWLQSKQSR